MKLQRLSRLSHMCMIPGFRLIRNRPQKTLYMLVFGSYHHLMVYLFKSRIGNFWLNKSRDFTLSALQSSFSLSIKPYSFTKESSINVNEEPSSKNLNVLIAVSLAYIVTIHASMRMCSYLQLQKLDSTSLFSAFSKKITLLCLLCPSVCHRIHF